MSKKEKIDHPKVIFHEEGHEYWVGGKKAISVSGIIDKFHDHLDEDYWQTYGAYKKIFGEEGIKQMKRDRGYKFPLNMKPPNEFFDFCASMTDPSDFFRCKDEVKQEWLDSQVNGTAFHLERENELYDVGYSISPFNQQKYEVKKFDKQFDNQSLMDDLSKLDDGCYPELLVWWEFENFTLTGQVDLAYLDTLADGSRSASCDDYKTNKKLGSKESYYKFHKPLNHLSDSKLVKYNLQQSLYLYLLSLWGYSPDNLAITHYKNYDPSTGKIYQFKYLKDEVELMCRLVNEQFGNI